MKYLILFLLLFSGCSVYTPASYSVVSDKYQEAKPTRNLTTLVVKNETVKERRIFIQSGTEKGMWFEVSPAKKFLGFTVPKKSTFLLEAGHLKILSDADVGDTLRNNFKPCFKYTALYTDVPFTAKLE